jgi:hypothetical protein
MEWVEPEEGDYARGRHDDDYFKRFNQNPWMQVFFDHYPLAPSKPQISADGSNPVACRGTPAVGWTVTGVQMSAVFSQPDGSVLTPTFVYRAGQGRWRTEDRGEYRQRGARVGADRGVVPGQPAGRDDHLVAGAGI